MQPLTTWSLPPDTLTDLILHRTGISKIAPRYALRDRQHNPVPIIPAGMSTLGDTSEIPGLMMSGQITVQAGLGQDGKPSQPVHATCDLVMKQPSADVYNPTRHYIKCFLDYYGEKGEILWDVPVGTFFFPQPHVSYGSAGIMWRGTGLDPTGKLNRIKFLNTWTIPQGTSYVSAIIAILTLARRSTLSGGTGQTPAGQPCAGAEIPLSLINIAPSTLIVPDDISFDRSTTLLDAVNQLLTAINYVPLFWAEGSPVGQFKSFPKLGYSVIPAPVFTLATDSKSIFMPNSIEQDLDTSLMANTVVVESNTTSGPAFSSIAINDSAESAISLTNMDETVSDYITDALIPDQATCDARAKYELLRHATANLQLSAAHMPVPVLHPHDPLTIKITDLQTGQTLINSSGLPFELTEQTIDLHGRTQTSTLRRLVAL